MYKHYFIIGFDKKGNVYGFDNLDPKDAEIREILKEMMSSNVSFAHRVWFSSEKDIVKVLKEKSCEFQNIKILKDLKTLLAIIK